MGELQKLTSQNVRFLPEVELVWLGTLIGQEVEQEAGAGGDQMALISW